MPQGCVQGPVLSHVSSAVPQGSVIGLVMCMVACHIGVF